MSHCQTYNIELKRYHGRLTLGR